MKSTYKILFAIAALLSFTVVFGQPGAPPATPIDGGLSLLLAGGAAYGIKKIKDARKKD